MPMEKFEREAPVDKKIEVMPKMAESVREEEAVFEGADAPTSALPQDSSAIPEKDEELLIIENILSENILGVYSELSAARQLAFKKRGEEVAFKIKILLTHAKVRVHDIFELIKKWLAMLPEISIYFLEQEAKIKTDKILQLKREGQEIEK
ncbi:MAG: hypothetical protein WC459_03185 [Patescibacteria group bacterium]